MESIYKQYIFVHKYPKCLSCSIHKKKTWKKIRGDFDSHTWNMCSSWNTSWTCWKTHKRYFIIYHLVLMSLPPPIKRRLIFSCSLYYHSKYKNYDCHMSMCSASFIFLAVDLQVYENNLFTVYVSRAEITMRLFS